VAVGIAFPDGSNAWHDVGAFRKGPHDKRLPLSLDGGIRRTASPGFGISMESLYLNLQYAFPVAQQYASGDTELQHKLGSQLHFFF
jgi:hypothetical protein